jgi:putative hydrolase of the HAD superfamily
MQRFDTVLLDAGGVLLDLDYAFLRRLVEARHADTTLELLSHAEAHARTSIDRRVREGGRSAEAWRDYFRTLLGHVWVPPELHDGIIDTLWDAHQRVGLWTVPIDGAVDAVRAIKAAGYKTGVVSNAEGRVANDLSAAGYDGLFDAVIDSHLVGCEKPDPAIFAIALEKLGSAPGRTVYLGDVPSIDVAGARAAGIFPVLLDRHDLYQDVDVTRLRAIAELPDWISNNQRT